jgi:bifunctional ADP-heptose synthase (sugar kinase/adenylyltransferase)
LRPEHSSDIQHAATRLQELLGCEKVLITLSEYGVFYQSKTENGVLPAHIRSIADVSGAGDTVISIAACCLAQGSSLPFLAGLSNLAGGLVCEEVGVVPVNSANLLHEAIEHLSAKA